VDNSLELWDLTMKMNKKVIRMEDGRQLIYYTFDIEADKPSVGEDNAVV